MKKSNWDDPLKVEEKHAVLLKSYDFCLQVEWCGFFLNPKVFKSPVISLIPIDWFKSAANFGSGL